MSASYSKSLVLYEQIRRDLQSGRYLPGQWIDAGEIAYASDISAMPVRLALTRLVGAGLLEDRGRLGLYVPLPNESTLRDQYSWMACLMSLACNAGATPVRYRPARNLQFRSPNDDLVKLTWQLFDAIAIATGQSSLHQAVKHANDKLAPIRRAKQDLLDHSFEELSELIQYWHARDYPSLRAALRDYHDRRIELVPSIVATLMAHRDALDE